MRRRGDGYGMSSRGGGVGNNAASYSRSHSGGGGDTFTHTRYERTPPPPGIGSKVTTSITSLLFGLLLILLGCLLLWNNEGWAIRTHRSLNEAIDAHRPITDAASIPTGQNDNELVHASHQCTVPTPTLDEEFGLSRPDAVSITRNVEIYQWVEHHRKERRKLSNGETEVKDTYSYNQKWVSRPVDSGRFHHPDGHTNYGHLPYEAATFRAPEVNLGAYRLDGVFVNMLRSSRAVPVQEAKRIPEGGTIQGGKIYIAQGSGGGVSGEAAQLPPGRSSAEIGNNDWSHAIDKKIVSMDGEDKVMYALKSTGELFSTQRQAIAASAIDKKIVSMDGTDKVMYSVKSTGELFSTQEKAIAAAEKAPPAAAAAVPANRQSGAVASGAVGGPQIGDVRIGFTEIRCEPISVLGKLVGDRLTSWPSKQGPGYDVALLVTGHRSAVEMVRGAQASNNVFTWVKRAGGWVLNFIGYSMVTQIVSTAADITLNWIPLLGPMAMSIIGLGLFVANLVMASTTTLLVASVAWVRYRPVLGISLLVGSLGLFYLASRGGRARGRKVAHA